MPKKRPKKRPKNEANVELGSIDRWSTDGCRGGKEGNPPGTAEFRHNFRQDPEVAQTRQAPRWGTANLNRCAKIAVPQRNPGEEVPETNGVSRYHPGTDPSEPGESSGKSVRKSAPNPENHRKSTKHRSQINKKTTEIGSGEPLRT